MQPGRRKLCAALANGIIRTQMTHVDQGAANSRRARLGALCGAFELSGLYVFGSRAAEVESWLEGAIPEIALGPADVDIGVGVGPMLLDRMPLREQVRLSVALEDLFGVERVDLVTAAEADAFLALNIIRGERLYDDRTTAADEFDLFVLRRAADLEPMARERQALVLGAS